MVCCNSTEDAEIIKALRAHGGPEVENEKYLIKINISIEGDFYNYFNLRSTDIAASIGISQFEDLDKFIKVRGINRLKF